MLRKDKLSEHKGLDKQASDEGCWETATLSVLFENTDEESEKHSEKAN